MINTSGKRPFMNRVLIKVDVEPEKTKGGIIIPEDIKKKADQKSEWGTLVAIGADAWEGSDDKCSIGDKVEFSKYGGKYDIGDDGLPYRMLDSHDILSVKI
jgi:chaperonin GroES